jgi:phage terminase large subunit
MTTARIELPEKLIPIFVGESRYRIAYGGRGSGKTRSFAKMAAVRGYQLSQEGKSGVIVCGREFMNSLDESSMAEVKAAIMSEPWLAGHYDVGEKYIRTRDGRISFAFIGLRHNLDSIKSKSQIHILWVDEAEPVSESAWIKTIPTVREHGSEIWVTWNPERKNSATHKRFREDPPEGAKITEINYSDNPWFPDVLEAERKNDLNKRPDQYAHIWEGDFVTVVEGAYYARSLVEARKEKRIGAVAKDPVMQLRAFWDIGVRDATAIWIGQFVGKEIRVLDYYEAIGQPLAAHLTWLRSNGYDSALCVLPHDGAQADQITATRFEDHIRSAGFDVRTIPNQGKGAALKRVESGRRLFPAIWFNEKTTQPGLDALGWYHEKRDDERNIGLGPDHDWSSHAADAFGLMSVAYEEPKTTDKAWKFTPRKVA